MESEKRKSDEDSGEVGRGIFRKEEMGKSNERQIRLRLLRDKK